MEEAREQRQESNPFLRLANVVQVVNQIKASAIRVKEALAVGKHALPLLFNPWVAGALLFIALIVVIPMVGSQGIHDLTPESQVSSFGIIDEEYQGDTSCPLPDFRIASPGSFNGSSNEGHGSNQYWAHMRRVTGRQESCWFNLPQMTTCRKPLNDPTSVCNNTPGRACTFYAYALDLYPGTNTSIILPTIQNNVVEWVYVLSFQNGADGYSYVYDSTQFNYRLVLTHLKEIPVRQIKRRGISGTIVGELHQMGNRTHLHMELQINGEWVKPELHYCKSS